MSLPHKVNRKLTPEQARAARSVLAHRWHAAYQSGDPTALDFAKWEYWFYISLCRAFKVKFA